MTQRQRRPLAAALCSCLVLSGFACDSKKSPPTTASQHVDTPPSAAAKPSVTKPPPLPSDISTAKARELLDGQTGYLYLDVRTVGEFAAGHVPGSLNIPILVITEAAGQPTLNSDFIRIVEGNIPKRSRLLVGCRSGSRSKRAQQLLIQAGYQSVANVLGGFIGKTDASGAVAEPSWSSLGYPVERGDGGDAGYVAMRARVMPPSKP